MYTEATLKFLKLRYIKKLSLTKGIKFTETFLQRYETDEIVEKSATCGRQVAV
ncbi:MAG: hypothetical protein LBJ00_01815 [Planctomycetaceae bacterium]|nr:hypothetical protein [Planctomycetaceae bacterium]